METGLEAQEDAALYSSYVQYGVITAVLRTTNMELETNKGHIGYVLKKKFRRYTLYSPWVSVRIMSRSHLQLNI